MLGGAGLYIICVMCCKDVTCSTGQTPKLMNSVGEGVQGRIGEELDGGVLYSAHDPLIWHNTPHEQSLLLSKQSVHFVKPPCE